MKDYYQRRNELLHDDDSDIAKLDDEKRIFDLRFQAACAAITGMCANDALIHRITTVGNVFVESKVAISRIALAQADELLKQMGVTE